MSSIYSQNGVFNFEISMNKFHLEQKWWLINEICFILTQNSNKLLLNFTFHFPLDLFTQNSFQMNGWKEFQIISFQINTSLRLTYLYKFFPKFLQILNCSVWTKYQYHMYHVRIFKSQNVITIERLYNLWKNRQHFKCSYILHFTCFNVHRILFFFFLVFLRMERLFANNWSTLFLVSLKQPSK